MADDFKLAHPAEYIKEFIKNDIRPDGRQLYQFRNVSFDHDCLKTSDGSSIVRLGNTIMSCGVKCELVTKTKDTERDNAIIANVLLTPLCSPKYKTGAPSVQAQTLSQAITNQFNSSLVLNRDLLTAPDASEVAFVLFVDVLCVNDDGNLFDAAFLATLLSLSKVKLPIVKKDQETGEMLSVSPSETPRSVLKQCFFPCSFAIFEDKAILADPTREEESVSSSLLTIVLAEDGKITLFNKQGGTAVSQELLEKCYNMAEERFKDVKEIFGIVFNK